MNNTITKNESRYCKVKDHYYEIDKITDTHVHASPQGGGFVYKIPINEVEEYCSELPVSDLHADFAEGDWLMDENENFLKFPCFVRDHDRWNGWAKPKFTHEVAMEVMKAMPDLTYLHTDKEGIHFTSENGDYNDEYPHDIAWLDKDGYYNFDGWCWHLKSDYPEEEEIDCPSCKGTGIYEMPCTQITNGKKIKLAPLKTKCNACNSTGKTTQAKIDKIKKDTEEFWCSCGKDGKPNHDNPQYYEEDGSHGWTCGKCGKVLQVG